VGTEDAFTTDSDAQEMHRLLVHSKLVLLEGVGHMPNLERETLFNGELTGFLSQLKNAADRVV
jgi:pimeloyl-ACP methyl ester carboxylesterase